jgi:hypothetical protein
MVSTGAGLCYYTASRPEVAGILGISRRFHGALSMQAAAGPPRMLGRVDFPAPDGSIRDKLTLGDVGRDLPEHAGAAGLVRAAPVDHAEGH